MARRRRTAFPVPPITHFRIVSQPVTKRNPPVVTAANDNQIKQAMHRCEPTYEDVQPVHIDFPTLC